MAGTRSPQEVFGHHAQALGAEDLNEIVADYSDDAVFISPAGVQRGRDGIREAFTKLLSEVPQAAWDIRPRSLRATSCFSNGPPKAAATGSTTVSTPSSSATA